MSHFTNVPGLTSLAVFLPEQCPHLIEILTNSQSSLTSLEILNGQFISKLATLHFPRLVAFHASNTSGKAGVCTFISRHASQLEELSLPVGSYWEPAFISLKYPKLRRLEIDRWGFPFRNASPTAALLSNIPHTCAIRTVGFTDMDLHLLSSSLVHLELQVLHFASPHSCSL
jgi:hypothetical protein